MADVVRERGQLFLVGAFALAVLFVALAVLLNAAIFTENLSTQGAEPSPGDAIEYHEAAVDAGERTLTSVNYANNSSQGTLDTALRRGVDEWGLAAATHRASQGHAASVSVDATTNGTRLTQDVERNFTNESGSGPDWTVAEKVHVRNFTMNVSQSSLSGGSPLPDILGYRTSDYLRVEFDNGSANWTAYIYSDSGDVSVEVVGASNSHPPSSCPLADPGPDGHVVIDFTDGRVGDQSCPGLDFFDYANDTYTIRIERALDSGSPTGTGTYSLVVDETPGSLASTSEFESAGSGQPFYTPAVYSMTLNVTYRAPDTDYEARVRIAPGEPDA
jgi:hypothetical protein